MAWLCDLPQGSRIADLRALEGLTQAEAAEKLSVSQSFVSQFEKGIRPLPSDVAARAAEVFELPETFFHIESPPPGVPTFRKSSVATKRDESRIVRLQAEAARLFDTASKASGYRTADLDAAVVPDVDETAANIRSMLGLNATEPILNVTRSLERLGVGVVSALDPLGADGEHSGISRVTRATDRPLVAVIATQPGDRQRFTLAHELGHWLFDRDRTAPIGGVRSPEEQRAHAFAGALLLPSALLRDRLGETLTLHGYLRIKADMGVSVRAILARAAALRLISAQRYRSLQIQVSSQGWRKVEPVEVAVEVPHLLGQAVAHGISSNSATVSEAVGVKRSLVERWTGLEGQAELPSNVITLRR